MQQQTLGLKNYFLNTGCPWIIAALEKNTLLFQTNIDADGDSCFEKAQLIFYTKSLYALVVVLPPSLGLARSLAQKAQLDLARELFKKARL